MTRFLAMLATGAALLCAVEARASVTIIGGGDAEACARAALTGKSDVKFEVLCTSALQTEFMDTRDRAGTYINRGVLKLRRLNWDAAMADFDSAVRIKPDMGEAYVNRGAALIGQHKFDTGLADINRGIQLGAEEPAKAYYNRALAYEGLGDVKSAYFDYQRAVELSPDWAAPKEQLVRFKVSRGQN